MTLPAAGWFPDPQDARRLRWWDGHAWGAATRVLPSSPESVAPIVVAPVVPAFSVHTGSIRTRAWSSGGEDRRLCLFTIIAVLLAATSVVVNPWGICGLLALAAGVVGMIRPGATGPWAVVARSASASAVVVAVTTSVIAASAQFHVF
ncbi:DUF2510 domain-containing protein [Curtobacterium sp. PhB115]|uniref:DUF2510 domain-containing protein n=1 Tax=Curtobacterium sp. PhB115 TaxID=2485173 RepID=UPI000FA0E5BB|nr:DUF2510 domain-containing protein [Curtobacterium sp. PhB115]ROP61521.1 uncharacterized protein DUF2510 [Curtobacterium sp. PhB115]